MDPKFEKTPAVPELLDLTILNAGQTANPPDFYVKMTPASNRSRGKYYCKVFLKETSASESIESLPSNIWDTSSSFAVIPSILILPFSFLIVFKLNM